MNDEDQTIEELARNKELVVSREDVGWSVLKNGKQIKFFFIRDKLLSFLRSNVDTEEQSIEAQIHPEQNAERFPFTGEGSVGGGVIPKELPNRQSHIEMSNDHGKVIDNKTKSGGIMYLWFSALVWLRNILVILGVISGYRAFSIWQSAGKNYNLMDKSTFIISICLVVFPLVVVGITKEFFDDKMKKLISKGKKLLESGEYYKAVETLDKAILLQDIIIKRVLPEQMVAYLYRGNAYAKLNNNEKALSDLERIIGIKSDFSDWKKLKEKATKIKEELQKNIEVAK